MKEKSPKKTGRPLKEIDERQVKSLAGINCSLAEMAAVLDCSEDTLSRRFAEVIKKGRESGKMSLKRKQYEVAMSGNVTMLIWLGKITVGQVEQVRQVVDQKSFNINATAEVQSSELKALVDDFKSMLQTKLSERKDGPKKS